MKRKVKLIIPFTEIAVLALTSCVDNGKSHYKYKEIELAKYHVVNEIQYRGKNVRETIAERTLSDLYYYNKNRDDTSNNEKWLKEGDMTISFNDDYRNTFDYDEDNPPNKIYAKYNNSGSTEQNGYVSNSEFKHYRWFYLKLQEMKGLGITNLSGFFLLSDAATSKNLNNLTSIETDLKSNSFEFSYDTYVFNDYEKETAGARYNKIYIKVMDEWLEMLDEHYEQYLGFTFLCGKDEDLIDDDTIFKWTANDKISMRKEIEDYKQDLENNFINTYKNLFNEKCVVTTKDFRTKLMQDEDLVLSKYKELVFQPYNDAIEHYYNKLQEWQNLKNIAEAEINRLKVEKMWWQYSEIPRCEEEIPQLEQENDNLETNLIPNAQAVADACKKNEDVAYEDVSYREGRIANWQEQVDLWYGKVANIQNEIASLRQAIQEEEDKQGSDDDNVRPDYDLIENYERQIAVKEDSLTEYYRVINNYQRTIEKWEGELAKAEENWNNLHDKRIEAQNYANELKQHLSHNKDLISYDKSQIEKGKQRIVEIGDEDTPGTEIYELNKKIIEIYDPKIEYHTNVTIPYVENLKKEFMKNSQINDGYESEYEETFIDEYRKKYVNQLEELWNEKTNALIVEELVKHNIYSFEPNIQLYCTYTYDQELLQNCTVKISDYRHNDSKRENWFIGDDTLSSDYAFMLPAQVAYDYKKVIASDELNGYDETWEIEYTPRGSNEVIKGKGYFETLPEITNKSLEFNYDDVGLVIALDYGICRSNYNIQTTLGAVHLTPTHDTYEHDLNNNKYQESELKSFERES